MAVMSSDYMKMVLISNLRFSKQIRYVASEVGRFSSDVLGVNNKGRLLEFEIKRSKSDLNNDFKKPKHQYYLTAQNKNHWVPYQFYFVVPKQLVEYAVTKCVSKPYGVIQVLEGNDKLPIQHRIKLIKRAKPVNKTSKANKKVVYQIVARMSSEIAGLRQKMYSLKKIRD